MQKSHNYSCRAKSSRLKGVSIHWKSNLPSHRSHWTQLSPPVSPDCLYTSLPAYFTVCCFTWAPIICQRVPIPYWGRFCVWEPLPLPQPLPLPHLWEVEASFLAAASRMCWTRSRVNKWGADATCFHKLLHYVLDLISTESPTPSGHEHDALSQRILLSSSQSGVASSMGIDRYLPKCSPQKWLLVDSEVFCCFADTHLLSHHCSVCIFHFLGVVEVPPSSICLLFIFPYHSVHKKQSMGQ